MNRQTIVLSTGEFKEKIQHIVRSLPLDEILLIPNSYVDSAIDAWLKVDPKTKVSPAQEEYRRYFAYVMSLPEELELVDIELYFFRIARKIVDTITLSMIESAYYQKVFNYADMEAEDAQFYAKIIQEVIARIDGDLSESPDLYKNVEDLKSEFKLYFDEVIGDPA